jgi:hypothetical protein
LKGLRTQKQKQSHTHQQWILTHLPLMQHSNYNL